MHFHLHGPSGAIKCHKMLSWLKGEIYRCDLREQILRMVPWLRTHWNHTTPARNRPEFLARRFQETSIAGGVWCRCCRWHSSGKTQDLLVYQAVFWHCIWHDIYRSSRQTFDTARDYVSGEARLLSFGSEWSRSYNVQWFAILLPLLESCTRQS